MSMQVMNVDLMPGNFLLVPIGMKEERWRIRSYSAEEKFGMHADLYGKNKKEGERNRIVPRL